MLILRTIFSLLIILGFVIVPVTVEAAGFEFILSNPQTSVTCFRGDPNCKYESVVHIYNRTGNTLYDPVIWTEGLPRNTVRYMLNGFWVEGRNIVKDSTAPDDETINTFVSIAAPDESGVAYEYLYIDGLACNQVNPPSDCRYIAGTALTITFNIVDTPTNTPSPTTSPSPEPPTQTPIPSPTNAVNSYWVSFTPQGIPSNDWDTAEEFLVKLQALGHQTTQINRWINGGWSSHIHLLPFNNFDIKSGAGYLLKYSQPSSLNFSGLQIAGQAENRYSLQPGWNLIGFPQSVLPYQINAEDLCQIVRAQSIEVTGIQDWIDSSQNNGYTQHNCGSTIANFPIQNRKGYFINSPTQGVFVVPSATQKAPTPTPTLSPTPTKSPLPTVTPSEVYINQTTSVNKETIQCEDKSPESAPILQKIDVKNNSVKLFWTEVKAPITYYLVAYGIAPSAYMYGNPNVGGIGTTSYTIDNLPGGKEYCFVVRAGNGCTPGGFSNVKCIKIAGKRSMNGKIPTGFTEHVLSASSGAKMRRITNTPSASAILPKIETDRRGVGGIFERVFRMITHFFK